MVEVVGGTALPFRVLPGGLGDRLSSVANLSVDDLKSSTGFLLVDRGVAEDCGLDTLNVSEIIRGSEKSKARG